MGSLPFRAWLAAQLGRNDPTGDLAMDAAADVMLGAMHTDQDAIRHLRAQCSRAAEEALRAAVAEWDPSWDYAGDVAAEDAEIEGYTAE